MLELLFPPATSPSSGSSSASSGSSGGTPAASPSQPTPSSNTTPSTEPAQQPIMADDGDIDDGTYTPQPATPAPTQGSGDAASLQQPVPASGETTQDDATSPDPAASPAGQQPTASPLAQTGSSATSLASAAVRGSRSDVTRSTRELPDDSDLTRRRAIEVQNSLRLKSLLTFGTAAAASPETALRLLGQDDAANRNDADLASKYYAQF